MGVGTGVRFWFLGVGSREKERDWGERREGEDRGGWAERLTSGVDA